jgi:hypothetical protein
MDPNFKNKRKYECGQVELNFLLGSSIILSFSGPLDSN